MDQKILKKENISILFDIRTFPYSNAFPQYNEPNIKPILKSVGITYKFLGNYIGGLEIKNEVKKGISSIKDIIKNEKIRKGVNYLYKQSKNNNVAIMCAEKSPFDCHRFLAIGSLLHFYSDIEVKNIIEDKILSFNNTIDHWKSENGLETLNVKNKELILQRLDYIYRLKDKREEKFPDREKPKTLELFK